MKPKFRPYSRITFVFSWLKYEEILKTLESQFGWLLQKMLLKPKVAIDYTEISSLICKTILIFNEHNFQNYFVLCKIYWYEKLSVYIFAYNPAVKFLGEQFFSND